MFPTHLAEPLCVPHYGGFCLTCVWANLGLPRVVLNTGIADMLPAYGAHAKLKPKYSIKIVNQTENIIRHFCLLFFFQNRNIITLIVVVTIDCLAKE
jgi:hypothetical protein